MISLETINLTTRNQAYDKPAENKDENTSPKKAPSTISLSNGPLTIEKPNLDLILCPPKSTLRNYVLNPNARTAQFYNVVEDFPQSPYAMSTL